MGINQSNPSCRANACLNQVIGFTNNGNINGLVEYQSCIAMFGKPTVTVTTAAPETVYSTATHEVPYTDITIEISTVVETVYQTTTSYAVVQETVTEYTTTNVVTEVTTVTVGATSLPVGTKNKKKKKKKRGACHHSTSAMPSSTVVESSTPPSSSVPLTSSTVPTSSTAALPLPIASNCPSLEEYSSACSCIYAVTSTSTYTEVPRPSTSATTLTVSSAILSTSVSVMTEYVTVTVPEAATTTLTSTVSTNLATTTRSTSTTSPPPAVTSFMVLANGLRAGRYLTLVSGYLQYDINNVGVAVAVRFVVPPSGGGGGQIVLVSDPSMKMVSRQTSLQVGVLAFENDATSIPAGNPAVTCTNTAGIVACAIPGRGFTVVYSCGAYLYIGSPSWAQSGCTVVDFRLSA
ncbi:hypothetical protein B0H66DRAFT_145448 [Apodospora peruviana]|uniref:Uncharacterized protein n=1 Tax=Apodospora peruviana TaxID=516989 RepID=A0AAE0MCI3_9PEZI|nr:hypothetical protein B0H66DRAFT_145448 [Apodospora peruviana]